MRKLEDIQQIDFSKNDGLVPAVVQDAQTAKVLMMGYMNAESIQVSKETGDVTFYSRSKKRLWTKGESSKNYLKLVDILIDCDEDTLLVKAHPEGPTCHKGDDTCWSENNTDHLPFLDYLTSVIQTRKNDDPKKSYTAKMFKKGINKLAQKVGEEAVELVIEAKDNDDELFKNEAADLLFHYMMLLEAKGFELKDIIQVLQQRHK